jgi:hypothetical protein
MKNRVEISEPLAGEVAEAKLYPNGRVYRIAGHFTDDQRVPPAAIVGAWQVDADGEIVGNFIRNPNYDSSLWPSPKPE